MVSLVKLISEEMASDYMQVRRWLDINHEFIRWLLLYPRIRTR